MVPSVSIAQMLAPSSDTREAARARLNARKASQQALLDRAAVEAAERRANFRKSYLAARAIQALIRGKRARTTVCVETRRQSSAGAARTPWHRQAAAATIQLAWMNYGQARLRRESAKLLERRASVARTACNAASSAAAADAEHARALAVRETDTTGENGVQRPEWIEPDVWAEFERLEERFAPFQGLRAHVLERARTAGETLMVHDTPSEEKLTLREYRHAASALPLPHDCLGDADDAEPQRAASITVNGHNSSMNSTGHKRAEGAPFGEGGAFGSLELLPLTMAEELAQRNLVIAGPLRLPDHEGLQYAVRGGSTRIQVHATACPPHSSF